MMITMATNIKNGTMIILHYFRVNSAADFKIAAAILNFLKLQHSASKENPAITQQIYAVASSASGLVHSSYP